MSVINIGMGNIYQGHVLEVLRTLPADTVDCVVTSPPYWGLRDYKIEPQIWDAQGLCYGKGHRWGELGRPHHYGQVDQKITPANFAESQNAPTGQFCLDCGAWRGSLGLEPTPELFVKHIVDIFREVRRVLKPTGVCFVNLGDSYSGGGQGGHADGKVNKLVTYPHLKNPKDIGLKPKDLCGIPWRVAFALQADGWWLRSDIIWSKPNPMPESVTDRPTKSHEYIFLLTKSARYFWNQEAVREPHSEYTHAYGPDGSYSVDNHGSKKYTDDKVFAGAFSKTYRNPAGRNIRSVWTFATEPTPEAHFATFPQELVKRCILAGCPEKGTVCDIFMGSGTTGIVAENLYRKWVGIELNPEYIEIARKRLEREANVSQKNFLKSQS